MNTRHAKKKIEEIGRLARGMSDGLAKEMLLEKAKMVIEDKQFCDMQQRELVKHLRTIMDISSPLDILTGPAEVLGTLPCKEKYFVHMVRFRGKTYWLESERKDLKRFIFVGIIQRRMHPAYYIGVGDPLYHTKDVWLVPQNV